MRKDEAGFFGGEGKEWGMEEGEREMK